MLLNLKIKTSLFTVVIVLSCLGSGCFSETGNEIDINSVPEQITSMPTVETEYEIYVLAIGEKKKRFFVISGQTKSDLLSDDSKKSKYVTKRLFEEFSELRPDTLGNFKDRNLKSKTIEEIFPKKKPYAVIRETELRKLTWADLFIEKFRKKYPNTDGYYTLSRVGFSKDGTQALLFTYFYCGGLCASGDYYLLSKDNGKWKVKKTFTAWVS